MCNAESQKRSAKGSNFKEDDSALPLLELLLYGSNPEATTTRDRNNGEICSLTWDPLAWMAVDERCQNVNTKLGIKLYSSRFFIKLQL